MSKNKQTHAVHFFFANNDHPVIVEWFNNKLNKIVESISVELMGSYLRPDAVKVETNQDRTVVKLSFITNFLGNQQLYTSLMGYILSLIDKASPYVEIKMYFECTDKRYNRFGITSDMGLMINGHRPIELRDVGTVAKLLSKEVVDIWVAGEPNACRKEVGRIRHLIRTENNHRRGLADIIDELRMYMSKDVALYIRTTDAPLGMVIHCDRLYENINWCDEGQERYIKAVVDKQVPDIYGIEESNDWNFDFSAFMEVMLDLIDARRECFQGYGGHEVVPFEYISGVMADIVDNESGR